MRCKGFALIRGPVGVGKSLFFRKLLTHISDDIAKRTNISFKYEENM